MGESDNQAWLFMLAESTLRRFAVRLTDDLPEDLAVLSQVQRPVTPAALPSGSSGASRVPDDSGDGEAGPPAGAGGTGSLGDGTVTPRYRISFSQHYRQLLLACF